MALVLALAMLFSQNALVYATEGADPVSGNETVETPAQTPAAEEAAEPAPETPAGEEAAEPETPAEAEAPAQDGHEQKPAADEEVSNEEASASENEAEPVSENEEEAEPEETSASVNAISDNTVSLSGGQIVISINDAGKTVSEDLLEYAEGITVSQSKIERFVGDPIGFDFKVISLNEAVYGASENIILKEDTDYKVTWMYEADGWGVSQNVTKDYKSEDPGKITVVIEGLSENDVATGYKGYRNSIRIELKVSPKEKDHLNPDDIKFVLVSYNRVTVSNNSKKNLFVTVVSQNGVPEGMIVQGDYIAPGTHKTIYSYYTGINKKANITENLPLAVVASYDSEFGVKSAGTLYKTFTSAKNTGGSTGAPEDGFEKINMKAVVSKSTQTIKLTWKPAKNLGYKYYELQRLGKNEETFTTLEGWKDKSGNTKLAKTGYTYGKTDVERAVQPAVFQLICYDKDKAEKARYITVAAPSLLYVEQGYDTNNMEYCFSKLYEDNDFAYRLELAEKNVENGSDAPGKRGFKQTAGKASIYYSTDMTEVKDFAIKKGLSVNALRDFFMGDEDLKLNPGTVYYCRVKTVYSWHGKDYTSAPSNVVSRKAGPSKVYVFDINGRKYTKPTGKNKEAIEAENVKNMTTYLDQIFGDEDTVVDPTALSSDGFIHKGNMGPDAKSGYVVFMADHISDNKLKGFELLRCDSQYGNYKKLKLYKIGSNDEPVKYSGLYKWTPTDPKIKKLFEDAGIDVYYMQYNKFPPEKPYYYAVRGVYRKGNAVGGFGDGYECTAELDDVQSFYGFDGTIDKINLYWKYDACVKEYWVYKKDYKDGTNPEDFGNISDYKLLKKVKGKKTGTLKENSKKASDQELIVATSGNLIGDYVKFTDKDNTKYVDKSKNVVKEGTYYQYIVVPKYNTKNQDVNYNLEKRSDVVCTMATLANAKIKNFKAANYGVERIRISWKKLKGATAYLIIRTSSNPTEVPMDKWLDEKSWVPSDDPTATPEERTAFNKCAFIDNTAVVGTKYYYVIFAGSEKSGSITGGQVRNAKSLPLAVTEVKVSNGDSFKKGGTISWTPDSRDKGKGVVYRIEYRDDGGSWKPLHTTESREYTDNKDLDRGVVRQYRVVSRYGDFDGGIKEGGSYSKPTKIELSTGSTAMALGETMTVNVYPRLNNGSAAKDIRLDGYSIGGSAIEVTGSKTEGDHVSYSIRAKARGTSNITFKAYDCSWTSGSSSSKLTQTITITVR